MINDLAGADVAGIQAAMLDALGEALTIAFIAYDKNDLIVYASRAIAGYFNLPQEMLLAGTRLRDFFAAVYDRGLKSGAVAVKANGATARDEWIAERISAHWRERSDVVEQDTAGRFLKFAKRRLPSGYGFCVVSDITEKKKREEQWRADIERIQLTEEILDNLSVPVFVCDSRLNTVAVNRAFSAAMGCGAESLLDRRLGDILGGDIGMRVEAAAQHVLETASPATVADTGRASLRFSLQRVGKPGRYFLVAVFDQAGLGQGRAIAAGAASITERGQAVEIGPAHEPVSLPDADIDAGAARQPSRLDGRKILLVTADREFEAQSLALLAELGVEACTVRSETEEDAFLKVALAVGVVIDLVVVDSQLDIGCLEIAEQQGIGAIALDAFDVPTQLATRVRAAIDGDVEDIAIDDWEITTRDQPRRGQRPAGPQILVAEDNEVNQIVFSQILEGLGYTYKIVADGEAAVEWFERHGARLVLLDLTLPKLTGIEVAHKLRAIEAKTLGATPIIGVLNHAVERDEHACLAAGMNETILKPLSPDIIEDVLGRYSIQRMSDFAV